MLIRSLLLLTFAVLPASAQWFADFHTDAGDFTCQLHEKATPRTVANFVTLAQGTRAWLNEETGVVSTTKPPQPFYNGLTFHRIVNQAAVDPTEENPEGAPAFRIIQGGCLKGDGTSSPGYTFPDEAKESVPESYSLDQPYVLAMANSGSNTNGSQFFITGSATSHLNGKHTVFGHVTSGIEVVEALLATRCGPITDANDPAYDPKYDDPESENYEGIAVDRPRTPPVIQSVTIRVVGRDAARFKPTAQKLPVVRAKAYRSQRALMYNSYHNLLRFKQPTRSKLRMWVSTDNGTTWDEYIQSQAAKYYRFIGYKEKPQGYVDVTHIIAGKTAPVLFRPVVISYPADAYGTNTPPPNKQLLVGNSQASSLYQFIAPSTFKYIHTPVSTGTAENGTFEWEWQPEPYAATLYVKHSVTGEIYRYRLALDARQRNGDLSGRQAGAVLSPLIGYQSLGDDTDFEITEIPEE